MFIVFQMFLSLSGGSTVELNQLELNGSCEPVVAEKSSHGSTWSSNGFEQQQRVEMMPMLSR